MLIQVMRNCHVWDLNQRKPKHKWVDFLLEYILHNVNFILRDIPWYTYDVTQIMCDFILHFHHITPRLSDVTQVVLDEM